MADKGKFVVWVGVLMLILLLPELGRAKPFVVNAQSAILLDVSSGEVLFEQNADAPIAPASITKILTLYILFEAMDAGRIHPWDRIKVSSRAANTGGSRMGLRTGDEVPVEELIKGMAVVSGNDACVAVAEHLEGSVENFVVKMNAKARRLGMYRTLFLTPNGLPAKGQLTTARDMAKLSVAYLHRFPESLSVHSLSSYTYRHTTHRNANRLLGTCYGVDGLKTGFVCASGYNIAATAKRGDSRILAVVMGARSPGMRARETSKLLEGGYSMLALAHPEKAQQFAAIDFRPKIETEERVVTSRGTKKAKIVRRTGGSKARSSLNRAGLAVEGKSPGKNEHVAKGGEIAVKRRGIKPGVARADGRAGSIKHAGSGTHSKAIKTISTVSATPEVAKKGAERKASPVKQVVTSKASHKPGDGSGGIKRANTTKGIDKGKDYRKRKQSSTPAVSKPASNKRVQPHASNLRQKNG